MTQTRVVWDASALLALGGGNRTASALLVSADLDPELHLFVPALSLLEADQERPGIAEHVGALHQLHTVDLDFTATLAVAELTRVGLSPGAAHAVHATRPSPEWPAGILLTTARPKLYEGLPVRLLPLDS